MDSERTWILLHQVEGPVNLGSACRAMANTGFGNLRFSGDLEKNDFEARRYALHARHILERAQKHTGFEALLAGLDVVFGFTPRSPWPDGKTLDLDAFHGHYAETLTRGKTVGLLFGNEARGLTNAQLAHCHFRVTLPAHADYISMNLAQAVLVVLWELHRKRPEKRSAAGEVKPEIASSDEKARLLDNVRSFLDALEFLDPQNPEHLWLEMIPLFKSRDWTKRELTLLHAVFAKSRSRHLAVKKKADRFGSPKKQTHGR